MNLVSKVLEFELHQSIFVHGMNKNCLFGSNDFHSKVLAIQINAEYNSVTVVVLYIGVELHCTDDKIPVTIYNLLT
jgi:hypothetical protein